MKLLNHCTLKVGQRVWHLEIDDGPEDARPIVRIDWTTGTPVVWTVSSISHREVRWSNWRKLRVAE